MAQHHYHPRDLPYGKTTSALWAVNPSRKLVIFVHGFGGAATATWIQFPILLADSKKGRQCDVIFYGYDGLKTRAVISALELLEALKQICAAPVTAVNNSLPQSAPPRDPAFDWDDIVVVAHSLGAVVSRQMLLFAIKGGHAWASKVRLLFFAPAHMGADVLRLAGEALTGLPGWVPALVKVRYQVLQDLEPGSQMLQHLRDEVQQALPAAPNLAARVILAGNDKVVSPVPFAGDVQPPGYIPDCSHTEVCKPTAAFRVPLQILESML